MNRTSEKTPRISTKLKDGIKIPKHISNGTSSAILCMLIRDMSSLTLDGTKVLCLGDIDVYFSVFWKYSTRWRSVKKNPEDNTFVTV